MSTTTQAAVKSALKTTILARSLVVTDHVQVLYGEPGDEGRRECIWIGTAQLQSPQEPVAFRKGRRDEDYIIKVFAENGTKPTPEATEARAVELGAEVEAVVIANGTLGVQGVAWIMPIGVSLQTTETGDGPRSVATISLSVKARLSP
jgi:hypothetical protein